MTKHREQRGEVTTYADFFQLDLYAALLEQLPNALEKTTPTPLNEQSLRLLREERGIYQLFHRSDPVYIGKADKKLTTRLRKHYRRCSGRRNINPHDISFRCLYLDKLVDATSPERELIKQYQKQGQAPWNQKEGFGSNDLGHGRKNQRPGRWFIDRPADYQAVVRIEQAGNELPMLKALELLREAVPFDLFRFASKDSRSPADKTSSEDYAAAFVTLERGDVPLLCHLHRIIEALPVGWQATVNPAGVTLYKERVNYDYALDGWRRTEQGVERLSKGCAI
jgi:hypothetical protein